MHFSAIILACVCAASCLVLQRNRPPMIPTIPNYVGALEKIKVNAEALEKLLPHGRLPITDPRRHYVIVLGVLAVVVDYHNSNCVKPDYDHQYLPAVDRLLPHIWEFPQDTVDKLEGFINDVNHTIHKIEVLKNTHCRNVDGFHCNLILLGLANNRTEYIYALDILEDLGVLLELFEKEDFQDLTKEYEEVALLLKGKERFKPLVMQAASVFKKMYGKKCYFRK